MGLSNEKKKSAEELIQTFAACSNFPKSSVGVKALADALKRASSDFGISMEELVRACADISTYCPVPREIRNVAIGIRDEIRRRKESNRDAEWRMIYGDPDPDWPAQLMGILAGTPHPQEKRACHIRAIRDMLFYTEGDGRELGDRVFWEGARQRDLEHRSNLVALVRAAGGWRTERELAQSNPEVRV